MKWIFSSCLLIMGLSAHAECESPPLSSLTPVSDAVMAKTACGTTVLFEKGIWPFNSYQPLTFKEAEYKGGYLPGYGPMWEFYFADKDKPVFFLWKRYFFAISGLDLDVFPASAGVTKCHPVLKAGDTITIDDKQLVIETLFANPRRKILASVRKAIGSETQIVELSNGAFSVNVQPCVQI